MSYFMSRYPRNSGRTNWTNWLRVREIVGPALLGCLRTVMESRVLIHRLSHLQLSKSFEISPISLFTAPNLSLVPQLSNSNLNSLFNHFPILTHFSRLKNPQLFPPRFTRIGPFSSNAYLPHVAQNVREEQSRMIKELKSMGFRDETIKRFFDEVPLAMLKDSVVIKKKTEILTFLGLDMDEIDRILCFFPSYFALNYETRLMPFFGELHEMGFTKKAIREVVFENPKLFLTSEAGELSRYVGLLKSLKCRQPIKDKILINGYLWAAMKMKLRIECLHKHGLILRDAFKVLYVEPRVILYDLEDIEKKMDFLLHKMELCTEHLIECPEYLGVNLEKQIIPRYNVIQYLRSIGGLGDEVWMKQYVHMSRMKFFNMFVKPYPQCQTIFQVVKRDKEVRPRHPVGLWKLFRPQKFP